MFIKALISVLAVMFITGVIYTFIDSLSHGVVIGILMGFVAFVLFTVYSVRGLETWVNALEGQYVTLVYYQNRLTGDTDDNSVLESASLEHLSQASQEYELRLSKVDSEDSLKYVREYNDSYESVTKEFDFIAKIVLPSEQAKLEKLKPIDEKSWLESLGVGN